MTKTADDRVIEEALARGAIRKIELLEEAGGLLSGEDAARRLGVGTQTIEQSSQVILIHTDDGHHGYPAFQFESEAMSSAVGKVLAAIGVDEPWAQLGFFFLRLHELDGRRPIEVIRAGGLDAVTLAASHFGRHGAS